jgi:hypothetical protein
VVAVTSLGKIAIHGCTADRVHGIASGRRPGPVDRGRPRFAAFQQGEHSVDSRRGRARSHAGRGVRLVMSAANTPIPATQTVKRRCPAVSTGSSRRGRVRSPTMRRVASPHCACVASDDPAPRTVSPVVVPARRRAYRVGGACWWAQRRWCSGVGPDPSWPWESRLRHPAASARRTRRATTGVERIPR